MSEWNFYSVSGKIEELERSNRFLTEELAATKQALLQKERELQVNMDKLSASQANNYRLRINRATLPEIKCAIQSVLTAINSAELSNELEMGWNCTWAFVGEAIRHEAIVRELANKHNEAVLAYQAEKKLLAETAANISGLNDTIDSISFELNRARRDRDEAVERSKRQADRICGLENDIAQLKLQSLDRSNQRDLYASKLEQIEKVLKGISL